MEELLKIPLRVEESVNFLIETEGKLFTGLDLFHNRVERIPMLIGEIIPKIGLWSLVGSSDTGKSMLLRQLAICTASGKKFLGWDVYSETSNVIFVATEDDEFATSYLLRRQVEDNPKYLEKIRFLFESEDIESILDRELEKNSADLVIIDAWADVFGQNLNDSSHIRQKLNQFKKMAIKHSCSIGFLHHTGKRTEKLAPSKNNILSGQGFEAKMRLVIELRNDTANEDLRHFCIVKGNYLPKDYKCKSFVVKMDPETFLFSATGDRVLFEDLSTVNENGDTKRERFDPGKLNQNEHYRILLEVFKESELKLSELKIRISDNYGRFLKTDIGGKITERIFSYLKTDLMLITDNGEKDKSPNKRYFLTTDHPKC